MPLSDADPVRTLRLQTITTLNPLKAKRRHGETLSAQEQQTWVECLDILSLLGPAGTAPRPGHPDSKHNAQVRSQIEATLGNLRGKERAGANLTARERHLKSTALKLKADLVASHKSGRLTPAKSRKPDKGTAPRPRVLVEQARAEHALVKASMRPLKKKLRSGETLTDAEQRMWDRNVKSLSRLGSALASVRKPAAARREYDSTSGASQRRSTGPRVGQGPAGGITKVLRGGAPGLGKRS